MHFIYVLSGWEGSTSDVRVLRDAIHRPHGLKVCTGCYYLVDGGSTNEEGFLAPYRGQRYHLSTWRDGPSPATTEKSYNMKHASARNVIERCFGLLKIRWAILQNGSYYPIKTRNRIIIACCLIHNLIRHQTIDDPLEPQLNAFVDELGDHYIDQVEPTEEKKEECVFFVGISWKNSSLSINGRTGGLPWLITCSMSGNTVEMLKIICCMLCV